MGTELEGAFHGGVSDKTAAWELRWWSPAIGIYCSRVTGHIDIKTVTHLEEGFMAVHEKSQQPITAFHDWQGITAYDSDARVHYTEWSKPIMDRVAAVHILFGSRLVSMGVSVANIVLGGKLHPTSDRASFERMRAAAVAKA